MSKNIIWDEEQQEILFDYMNATPDFAAARLSGPLGKQKEAELWKLSGVNIFDVFELDGKIHVLDCNGDLAYLKNRSQSTNGIRLKFLEKIRAGARTTLAIREGFVTLLVMGGCWYLNLYKKVDNCLELTQSCKLGSLPVETPKCSCMAATCEAADLDPALSNALFPNVKLKNEENIVFLGFATGQVYYFNVPTMLCEDTAVTMLYVSPEPVLGIFMYHEPSTKKYSCILLIQQSGALVVVSGREKSLRYSALYLPSNVHCIGQLDMDVLWSSDGVVVWQSKVVRNDEGDLLLQSSCVRVGNVDFLSCIAGQNEAIGLTSENKFFYLRLTHETGTRDRKLSNYAARQEKIIEKIEQLAKLKQEIAKEDLQIDAINFARRAELIRDKFDITVKIHDAMSHPEDIQLVASANQVFLNVDGRYIIEGSIENNSGHEIFSPSWSLQVTVKLGSISKLRVIDLNRTFVRNSLKFQFPLQVVNPCVQVSIECHLVAELNLEANSKPVDKWVIIPIGSTQIHTSHFFKPVASGRHRIHSKYIPGKVHVTQDNLQKIAEVNGVGVAASSLMEKPRTHVLNSQIESNCVLSLPDGSNHEGVWLNITRHCWHRCEKMLRSQIKRSAGDAFDDPVCCPEPIRIVDLLIGSKRVKLTLDLDCTKLEISCCDVQLLHAVKDSIISLLRPSGDVIDLDPSLARQVQEFKTAFELEQREAPNAALLRNKWREITSQLPL